MKAWHIHPHALLWIALLVGCGSSAGGTTSPDGSAEDAGGDGAAVGPNDGAVSEDGAAKDAPGESPDVDNCAGVRCAGPSPCGQPCTGCCCNPSCPPDAGPDAAPQSGDAATGDAGAACINAGDCKVVAFECTGCDCLALAASAADPVCQGPGVQCLVDPCNGKSAACVGGHCAVMQ